MPNGECNVGVQLTERVAELQRKAAANELEHQHMYELIDKMRNRPPAWVTVVIGCLMGLIGLLGGLVL